MPRSLRAAIEDALRDDVRGSDAADKDRLLAALVHEWEAILQAAGTRPTDARRAIADLAPTEGMGAWARAERASGVCAHLTTRRLYEQRPPSEGRKLVAAARMCEECRALLPLR